MRLAGNEGIDPSPEVSILVGGHSLNSLRAAPVRIEPTHTLPFSNELTRFSRPALELTPRANILKQHACSRSFGRMVGIRAERKDLRPTLPTGCEILFTSVDQSTQPRVLGVS